MANPAALSDLELAVLTMALESDELVPTAAAAGRDAHGKPVERTDKALALHILATAASWKRGPETQRRVLDALAVIKRRAPRTIEQLKAARESLTAVCLGKRTLEPDA